VTPTRCPCGGGLPLAECCGPLLEGVAAAPTAERLMRSRYTAFALGRPGYLRDTWHSSTRPAQLHPDPAVRWTGLEVTGTSGGSLLAAEGTVEFRASYAVRGRTGVQHERSRFVREDGAWRYLDGISLG
jgi:SEC-C motif-containing protein